MTQPNVAVKHLFLLMGDNPLPNAVAALTLLEPEGTPYLVHTRKTQPAAERLEAVLQEFPRLKPAQLIDLETYQADSFQIRQRIQMRTESQVALVCCRWNGEGLRRFAIGTGSGNAGQQDCCVWSARPADTGRKNCTLG